MGDPINVPALTALDLLAELEWVDGDDLCPPGCRFCNACGPRWEDGKQHDADLHDAECPLAFVLGRLTKADDQ